MNKNGIMAITVLTTLLNSSLAMAGGYNVAAVPTETAVAREPVTNNNSIMPSELSGIYLGLYGGYDWSNLENSNVGKVVFLPVISWML
jgi:hypothetical protein